MESCPCLSPTPTHWQSNGPCTENIITSFSAATRQVQKALTVSKPDATEEVGKTCRGATSNQLQTAQLQNANHVCYLTSAACLPVTSEGRDVLSAPAEAT